MSVHAFNAKHRPILVEIEIVGPAGKANLKVVLDTGATTSLIKLATLLYLGFDPTQASQRVKMTTGSGVETVPVVVLTRLSALGQHRFGFPVIAHALPASAAVDGLLGLDFLRGHELAIDFRTGWLTLA
jgi:predicted aspartyl protease